ncbi:MAG TPA: tellurite resistance TerB family protein [Rhodopila sp.]|uniref:tellurite resistance TerB family protein n=1 Tax=Rhodopila sp. TaxID=2480087 RepID=UPI002BCF78B1|nr:tellurite resistance TerB family protein [Rhodopila sp.]HVY17281.1 tellurite resistance TerB family protein [Rhodopila sp.]
MRTQTSLNAPEALVLTMVLVAVADEGITDREIGIMAGQVQTLPAFQDFTTSQLNDVTEAAVRLLNEEEGLSHAASLIRNALSPKLRETAYALACEVIAGGREGIRREPRQDAREGQALDMLEFVRRELGLDTLIALAIERGIRARYQRADAAG